MYKMPKKYCIIKIIILKLYISVFGKRRPEMLKKYLGGFI